MFTFNSLYNIHIQTNCLPSFKNLKSFCSSDELCNFHYHENNPYFPPKNFPNIPLSALCLSHMLVVSFSPVNKQLRCCARSQLIIYAHVCQFPLTHSLSLELTLHRRFNALCTLKAAGFPLAFPALAQAAPITANQCENDSPHQSVRCSGETRKIRRAHGYLLCWQFFLTLAALFLQQSTSTAAAHDMKQMGYIVLIAWKKCYSQTQRQ